MLFGKFKKLYPPDGRSSPGDAGDRLSASTLYAHHITRSKITHSFSQINISNIIPKIQNFHTLPKHKNPTPKVVSLMFCFRIKVIQTAHVYLALDRLEALRLPFFIFCRQASAIRGMKRRSICKFFFFAEGKLIIAPNLFLLSFQNETFFLFIRIFIMYVN